MTLGLQLGVGHIPYAHVALGLLPAAHSWCLGSCLKAGHTPNTRDAWAAYLGAGHTPSAHMALGLRWGCPCPHPLGDTWRLAHVARPNRNGPDVGTHDQWVLHKDPIELGSPLRPKVPGSQDSKYYYYFQKYYYFYYN